MTRALRRDARFAPAWGAGVALLVSFAAPNARAYQIGSAATEACHEEMTLRASRDVGEGAYRLPEIALPEASRWSRIARSILEPLVEARPEFSSFLDGGELEFFAMSVVLGSRSPDTEGRATTDANALRRIHGDPTGAGQYRHALRAIDDDGPEGDVRALTGAKANIAERLELFARAHGQSADDQVTDVPLFVDHHGNTEVPVWTMAFRLGEALHTLEDSHAHTLRSSDGRHVVSVLNYVEAAAGTASDESDGMAHSRTLDDCRRPDLAPLVDLSVSRGRALVRAAFALGAGRGEELAAGLGDCAPDEEGSASCGWLEYEPSCEDTLASKGTLEGSCCEIGAGHCETTWLGLAEDAPSAPLLSCANDGPGRGATDGWWLGAFGVFLIGAAAARRRASASVPFALVLFGAEAAEAAETAEVTSVVGSWFVGVEVHGSLLADQSAGTLTDVTFGPALRAGVRPFAEAPRWSLLVHFEQDSWLALEQTSALVPGVVNFGLGTELALTGELSSSMALGTSVLVFDTALTNAPSAGLFVDVRPLSLHLPVAEHLVLDVSPLGVAWEAPVLSEPSLSLLHYRATLGLSWRSFGAGAPRR